MMSFLGFRACVRSLPAMLTALVIGSATALAGGKMVLNTEEYPPYQTLKDGKIEGENVKVVRELFRRAGIPIEIRLDKWDKSFNAALDKVGQGVFTAIRNQEREKLFQWVGPISVTRWVLLAKKSKGIKIEKLEDAFKYRIGGYKDDAKTQYLVKAGATVEAVESDATNAKRLAKGDIDLWATGYISGMKYAKEAGLTDVEEVYVFREDYGYIALNLETSAATVLTLNRIVDEMKSEGKLDATLKFKK